MSKFAVFALVLFAAADLSAQVFSPNLTATDTRISIVTHTDGALALGTTFGIRLETMNAPQGSHFAVFASLASGQSTCQYGQFFFPLEMLAPTELVSGTLPSGDFTIPVTVPQIPGLVGTHVHLQYIVNDGVSVSISNLAVGGPILQDILFG